jgi:hypothetical protein
VRATYTAVLDVSEDSVAVPVRAAGCRVGAPPTRGVDLWWSGKHRHHGGNIQVVSAPDGWPLWTSDVRPGREHDTTAARHDPANAITHGDQLVARKGSLAAACIVTRGRMSPRSFRACSSSRVRPAHRAAAALCIGQQNAMP